MIFGDDGVSESFFSVIVPVFNGGESLRRAVQALNSQPYRNFELIIVDDGSTDGAATAEWAYPATLITVPDGPRGPAFARNLGASAARGRYLFFIDADCYVHADTLATTANILEQEPELCAVFGSYDDRPINESLPSQFKNLLHHYTHQRGAGRASTFWAGCGAMRRTAFAELGGFDAAQYSHPSIEDIELGYRMRRAGLEIKLAPEIQVTHAKTWTVAGTLKSDILDRGIPWIVLIWRYRAVENDLNLNRGTRASVALLAASLGFFAACLIDSTFFAAALLALLGIGLLNADMYRYMYRKRGFAFLAKSVPLHLLYLFACGCSVIAGSFLYCFFPTRHSPPLLASGAEKVPAAAER